MRGFAVDEPGPAQSARHQGHRRAGDGLRRAALLCAISDALGGHYFNRTPVTPDMIVNAAGRIGRSRTARWTSTA
jgi:hypothetical protein